MFLSDKDFSIDRSKKAGEVINRLDSLLNTFIINKRYVTSKMTKGYLDYHGLTSDKFAWRFEAIMDSNGSVSENIPLGNECIKDIKTAEQFFDMEYETIKVVQDKCDEYYNDIASRNFSIGVKSIPYNIIRYVFTSLISKKFDNHKFKQELQKAQFDATIKGTGFLRVSFEDKEKSFGTIASSPIKVNTGVRIERVDPEDVFVDPIADNPQEMFIINSYETSELLNKFPILNDKKFIREINENNIEGTEVIEKASFINRTWRRPRHIGETLLEIYSLKDLTENKFQLLLSGINEQGGIVKEGDQIRGRNVTQASFIDGYSSLFYNSYLNSWVDNTPAGRRDMKYEVVEYYNLNTGMYIVYIDNVILYQGVENGSSINGEKTKGIPEPFKSLPIVPIYMDNKYTGYYGNPLTEYFASFQKMITEADHAQRLNTLLTGQETVIIDSSQIDEDYHPNKEIQLAKNSPLNTIHIKPELLESGRIQPAITPLQFSSNSSVIHQNRKNDIINLAERQFPSLKAIIASNSPEAQRDTMYSRDIRVNLILKRQQLALADLAYKTFVATIYELDYFSPNPNITIPMFEGSQANSGFTIAKNEKELKKLRENKLKELEQLYIEEINNKVNEYKNNNEVIAPIIQQVKQEIVMKVVSNPDVLKLVGGTLGNSPEEQQATITALMGREEIMNTVRAVEASELERVVTLRLSDMAKNEVQKIPDNNFYFSIESLNNYTKLLETIEFSFEKSRLERENDMLRFTNMITPFQQLAGFMYNTEEMAKEIAIASGFNPEFIVQQKQQATPKMYEIINTKSMISQNLSLDKVPLLITQYANEQLGTQRFTEQDIVQSIMGLEQMKQKLKLEEVAVRNTTRAETDIIKNKAFKEFDGVSNEAMLSQQNQGQNPTGNVQKPQ